MTSIKIDLPADTWVQVTTTEVEGSISQSQGGGFVDYLEASVIPVSYDEDTPIMKTTEIDRGFSFNSVSGTEFIFAYAIGTDAKITLTSTEV